jgi:hypothetical protein
MKEVAKQQRLPTILSERSKSLRGFREGSHSLSFFLPA